MPHKKTWIGKFFFFTNSNNTQKMWMQSFVVKPSVHEILALNKIHGT